MNIYNFFLEKIILPIGDILVGGSFMSNLNRLKIETRLNESELTKLQNERLFEILNHATKNSIYYQKFVEADCISPSEWLKQFPILDKRILNERQNDLICFPKSKMIRQVTSGSSGIHSTVFWSKNEQSIHRATQVLWWQWAGYYLGMPMVQTGMTPNRGYIKALKDKLLNTFYFVAFVPDKVYFKKALEWASKQKVVFLGGYSSSLFVLSQFSNDIKENINFKGAVSWGDKLFDHYKKSIENSFDLKIRETYGTSEGMMIAAQKDLDYMYIMSTNVYLEILDDDGNEVADGEIGNVVVTSLVAKGMPLIRYKIGDLAIKLPRNEYPNNRDLALPLLKKVIGRDTDLVKTSSGKILVVHTFTGILEFYPEIKQFCVIQEDLSGIFIEYIPNPNFNLSVLCKIKDNILKYLNEPFFKIEFIQVDKILPTPSGKPQIIISKLKSNKYL